MQTDDLYYTDPGMASVYNGVCVICKDQYHKGDLVCTGTPRYWVPLGGGRYKKLAHRDCALRMRRDEQPTRWTP
jgi:hypothetical protein